MGRTVPHYRHHCYAQVVMDATSKPKNIQRKDGTPDNIVTDTGKLQTSPMAYGSVLLRQHESNAEATQSVSPGPLVQTAMPCVSFSVCVHADKAAQVAIVSALQQAFPSHAILGEPPQYASAVPSHATRRTPPHGLTSCPSAHLSRPTSSDACKWSTRIMP